VNQLCQTAGLSRAGYYRFLLRPQRQEVDMDLRSQIQRIALQWPAYGYRRVQAELERHGWLVNHKRVLRLMRADNLLCLRRRKFVLTTDSKHGLPIYPNLAQGRVLTGINQLWVADITYIRLAVEFVYLAVLLDAFSRSCIGLGSAAQVRSRTRAGGLAHGVAPPASTAGIGAPLRPRCAVRVARLHAGAQATWHPEQHESARKCL